MKSSFLLILACMVVLSCSPVLRQDSINRATFNFRLSEIKQYPARYRGKLFVFGGTIVSVKVVEGGSLIEALYVPVDSRGYLQGAAYEGDKYLALYSKYNGLLEQMIFHENREITITGEFIGLHKEKTGETDYIFPVFRIEELYLWAENKKGVHARSYFHKPLLNNEYEYKDLASLLQGKNKALPQDISVKSDETGLRRDSDASAAAELPGPDPSVDANEKTIELPKQEEKIDLQEPVVNAEKTIKSTYQVQVGAFKNTAYAERMLKNIRVYYPEVYIFIENDFNKVRIPGVKTKEEGISISGDIEKKFNMKPIIILHSE